MLPLAPRITGNFSQPTHIQIGFDRIVQYLRNAPSAADVVWKPGAAQSSANEVRTWDEVMQFVAASSAPVTIWVERDAGDPPLTVPAGVYELNQAILTSTRLGDPSQQVVSLADGALLRNIRTITGSLVVQGNSTAGPCLDNDPMGSSPRIFLIAQGAALSNQGTVPMIDVPVGEFAFVVALDSTLLFDPASTAAMVGLNSDGIGFGSFLAVLGIGEISGMGTNIVSGDAFCAFGISHQGMADFPFPDPWPLFSGTFFNSPMGQDGGFGPTSQRPTDSFFSVPLGCCYVDTTIAPSRPIWLASKGPDVWIDATGAVVP